MYFCYLIFNPGDPDMFMTLTSAPSPRLYKSHPPTTSPYPCSPQSSAHHNAIVASKRKRSWSRAVFTTLQRKELEKRFELQKYVNKPDRRHLASTLGLTDTQVHYFHSL